MGCLADFAPETPEGLMHELSICQSLLDIVLDTARKNDATRVSRVNVEIGELRGVVPDSLTFYFEFLTKDTMAEGAELHIDIVPARKRCRTCGAMHLDEGDGVRCPLCQSTDAELVMGMELQIRDIEVE